LSPSYKYLHNLPNLHSRLSSEVQTLKIRVNQPILWNLMVRKLSLFVCMLFMIVHFSSEL